MYRKKLKSKIKKKTEERELIQKQIAELEAQLTAIEAHISGLEEALKIFPSENGKEEEQASFGIRKGSLADRTREVLKKAGHPMKLDDILNALGEGRKRRQSLSGTLSQYFRHNVVFTRPYPGTFGLKEFEKKKERLDSEFDVFKNLNRETNQEK